MNQIIPITLLPGALPANLDADPQAYYEAIMAATKAEFDASEFLLGKIGGTMPTTNQGPWLKNEQEWWVWDVTNHTYVPMANEVEIGDVMMTMRPNCDDSHWLFCDGREITRNQPYDKLFAVIGTNFNLETDSDPTKFRLPRSGSRVPIGVGIGVNSNGTEMSQRKLYEQGGLEQVTLDATNMPPHLHSIAGEFYNPAAELADAKLIIDDNHSPTHPRTTNTGLTGGNPDGSTTPHNNMMPWFSVLMKIKFQ